MKTVTMERDFDFHVTEQQNVSYLAGQTYERVPEAHWEAIKKAGAGNLAKPDAPAAKSAADK